MDLMKWQIFSLLEPDFVYKIKMACVYGMYYVTVFCKQCTGYVTVFCKQCTGSWIRKSEYTLLLAGYLIIPCFQSEKAHFWL
jgi:hypothetical protein